jgi:hypothetical protein
MQVGVRSLLAASLVAWVSSCALNDHGLGSSGASPAGAAGQVMGAAGAGGIMSGGAGGTGAGGTIGPLSGNGGASVGGATGLAGNQMGAAGSPTGAGGDTSGTGGNPTGAAGNSAGTGGDTTGAAGLATGAAGDSSGAAGAGGTGGTTSAGGASGDSTAGASGSGGSAGPDPGCSDGTREGYLDTTMYPTIAACAGAWDTPGLDSTDARTPQCGRQGGNDGNKPDGHGCSVVDLCEAGWHVCTTDHGVGLATMGAGCDDAVAPAGGKPVFYVTRQRGIGLTCDNSPNPTGTNNLYGCGNIGSTADRNSCTPLTRMMRDSDCLLNSPWMCSDGPNGTSQDEYNVVTKGSSSRGGALCCHD